MEASKIFKASNSVWRWRLAEHFGADSFKQGKSITTYGFNHSQVHLGHSSLILSQEPPSTYKACKEPFWDIPRVVCLPDGLSKMRRDKRLTISAPIQNQALKGLKVTLVIGH